MSSQELLLNSIILRIKLSRGIYMKRNFIIPTLWASEIIKLSKERTLSPQDIEFYVNSLVRCSNKNEVGETLKEILRELIM